MRFKGKLEERGKQRLDCLLCLALAVVSSAFGRFYVKLVAVFVSEG